MDLVTEEKLRGESTVVKGEHGHIGNCETKRMTAEDNRCQLVAKRKVLGVVYRRADLLNLCVVPAAKSREHIRVG